MISDKKHFKLLKYNFNEKFPDEKSKMKSLLRNHQFYHEATYNSEQSALSNMRKQILIAKSNFEYLAPLSCSSKNSGFRKTVYQIEGNTFDGYDHKPTDTYSDLVIAKLKLETFFKTLNDTDITKVIDNGNSKDKEGQLKNTLKERKRIHTILNIFEFYERKYKHQT